MIKLLSDTENNNLPIENLKIIYVAPIKALCRERFQDWEEKFSCIGVKCKEVTGDSEINDITKLYPYQLILTTPEKWDSLTRKWRDYREFVDSIKLFLIDEIHLLNEPKRGPSLEAIISRMKTICNVIRMCKGEDISTEPKDQIRFIAVSATIPNIEDLALWLGSGRHINIKYHA